MTESLKPRVRHVDPSLCSGSNSHRKLRSLPAGQAGATLRAHLTSREKEITKKVVDILRRQLKPRKIILFGSRAKGTHGHGSDFDFAVDLKRPDMKKETEIRGAIEAVSGLYSVDVIYLKSVDPGFRTVVHRTGKVVYGSRR